MAGRGNVATSEAVRAIVLIALLMVAIIVLTVGGLTESSYRIDEPGPVDRSVFNSRASGSQGLYELANRLGYHTLIWKRNWSALPKDARVLIAIDPQTAKAPTVVSAVSDDEDQPTDDGGETALSAADAHGLMDWLSGGRTAILMTSALTTSQLSGQGSQPGFADVLGMTVQSPTNDRGRTQFPPLQPLSVTQNIVSVNAETSAGRVNTLSKTLAPLPLFADVVVNPVSHQPQTEPYIVVVPVGAGRLYLVADGEFASNNNLGRAGNAQFLANVLKSAAQPRDAVLFDEYFHGDRLSDTGLWEAMGRPMQMATLQILLAMLVMLAALAPRFGRPLPANAGVQRTAGEYVASLASLYAGGKATTAALEPLYRQFLRDVCAYLGVASDITLDRLATIAAKGSGVTEAQVRNVLLRCENAIVRKSLTEAEMVYIVRDLEALRKELKIV